MKASTKGELHRIQRPFEIKSAKQNEDTVSFTGLASVYEVVDRGDDVVRKGAFTKTIAERPDVILLWQHDTRIPVGGGKLSDVAEGLQIDATIETGFDDGKKAGILVLKNLIRGLSIGYQTIKADFVNGGRVRELLEVAVWEVSLATFPMNPAATISSAKDFHPFDESWILRMSDEIKSGRVLGSEQIQFLENAIAESNRSLSSLSALYDSAKAAAVKAAGPPKEPAIGHSVANELQSLKDIFTI